MCTVAGIEYAGKYPKGPSQLPMAVKIISLFCKRALQKRRYSVKETYNICVAAHMSHALQMCRYNRTKKIFEQTNVLSVYTFGWSNTNIRKGAQYKSKSL